MRSDIDYSSHSATTLTGFHFALTALVGFVSNATGLSASKHVPLWELIWFSIVANVSIAAMNFSLMLNSVGFYQISKLSMIPVVCVMEWILHSKRYSREVKVSVVVVVVGVGICTVTDVKVNAKGFICACVAIFSSSLQQIVCFIIFFLDWSFKIPILIYCVFVPVNRFLAEEIFDWIFRVVE